MVTLWKCFSTRSLSSWHVASRRSSRTNKCKLLIKQTPQTLDGRGTSPCQTRHLTGHASFTIDNIAEVIKHSGTSRVLVMAGAGISTASGIQDFRTPGSGLYYNLQKYHLPYPEAIFELDFFFTNPKPFFEYARELVPGKYAPNAAHFLPALLHRKDKLLRMYTQNIDSLGRLAGIPDEKLVEAHGTFSTATCTICTARHTLEDIKKEIDEGTVPRCREHGCKGVIKPDIVFFGEALPDRFYMYAQDVSETQVLIVMGTSLEVMPFAGMADEVPSDVPRLLMNNDRVGSFGIRPKDVMQTGDIVASVEDLVARMGWDEDFKRLRAEWTLRMPDEGTKY
ncbi:unnamed protein product [Ixodes pacificus]